MRTMQEYIDEEVVVTGFPIRPSSAEGYVSLFFNMLSSTTKAYKVEKNTQNYTKACGYIYDPESKTKINNARVSYRLMNDILIARNKIFYTLELNVEAQNVIIMYRDYKNKDLFKQYMAIVSAKKNIINALKNSGFTVKSDRMYIYVSTKNYFQNPETVMVNGTPRDFGNITMNKHQEMLFNDFVKNAFTYEGVFPGFNRYAIKLVNASAKEELVDVDHIKRIFPNTEYAKIIISTNGTIKAFAKDSTEPDIVLNGAFAPIKIENE